MNRYRFHIILCVLLGLSAVNTKTQGQSTYQNLLDQGQAYEDQGQLKKALDTYQKAKAQAPASYQPMIAQIINHLEEEVEKQRLVFRAQTEKIKAELETINNAKRRTDLQNELTALRQRDDATKGDYDRLARRVKAALTVEEDMGPLETAPVAGPPPGRFTAPPKSTPAGKPTGSNVGPPPKTITSSTPNVEAVRHKQTTKNVKTSPKVN